MAVVVAVMTAFYTFRMIGMAFFGKKSKHLEEMEHRGHHLHEVGANMWVPFAVLAVATIAIGIIGFSFGAQITHLLGGYLAHYFGIGKESASPEIHILPEGGKTFFGLNPIGSSSIIWILCNRRYSGICILHCKKGRSRDYLEKYCDKGNLEVPLQPMVS